VPTLLLDGAFGERNPGTEAVLDAFLAALPDWQTVVASSRPRATMAGHGCPAVRRSDLLAVAGALRDADAVVFAGGSLFGMLAPEIGHAPHERLKRARRLGGAARLAGKPLAMLGVGASRLTTRRAKALARSIVRRADLLVLRDEESAQELTAAGALAPFRVGADPAWTLVDTPQAAAGPREAIVLALHPAVGGEPMASRLVAALQPLAASGRPVRLLPWQIADRGPNDLDLARALAGRLGGRVEVMDPPVNLADARSKLSSACLLLSLRAHALVAAAAAATPFVAVALEPKMRGLARRLGQPLIEIEADPATIRAAIVAGMHGQPAHPAAVQAEIARAEEGFRLLRLLLSGGAAAEFDTFDGLRLEPFPWATS
jgi:polysaccharide pyruvyl transferase WcaK-like protein